MKILFLCHRLPYPPNRGGKIRPFNMIRHLSRRHRVTVATIARSAEERERGEGLRKFCHDLHVGMIPTVRGWARFAFRAATPYPSTFAYFSSPALRRAVQTLLAREAFDVILVHCSSMGPYVGRQTGCPKVMDFGDADSEKWLEYARTAPFPLSLGFRLEAAKVRRWERGLAERFDVCTVVSARERDVLAAYVTKPIEVIPNGVDLEYFRSRRDDPTRYHPRRLVFTGNMSYRPNVDAVRYFVAEVLPRIRQALPDVELYIVGMDPSAAVRRLADAPRVVVTGRVDDVRPYFEDAAVAVGPLRMARGLQNKVVEAMAMRVPVVATPAACQGINAGTEHGVLVAADAEAFSRSVLAVLRDPGARERYAAAARAYVEEHHDWDQVLGRLEDLVTSAARGGTRAREEALPTETIRTSSVTKGGRDRGDHRERENS